MAAHQVELGAGPEAEHEAPHPVDGPEPRGVLLRGGEAEGEALHLPVQAHWPGLHLPVQVHRPRRHLLPLPLTGP